MAEFALLCPGQGAQHAEMLALATGDSAAGAFLNDCEQRGEFGMPLAQALHTPAHLFANRYAQPLIVAATLANFSALRAHLPAIDLVAGYSIGEVTAQALAGACSWPAAVALARQRALAMEACCAVDAPQAMLAVGGVATAELAEFCRQQHSTLALAIITAENQAILAGPAAAIVRAELALQALPNRRLSLTVLPVHIASHTPLMNAATPLLAAALAQMTWHDSEVPVLAGLDGRISCVAAELQQNLLAQLSHTIRWHDCMDALNEAGVRVALELGPGAALSRMLRARHPHIAVRSVSEFRSVSGVAQWLQRQVAD